MYLVSKEIFEKAQGNPKDFDVMNDCLSYASLENMHEGLRYILSRNQPREIRKLVDKLFNPSTFISPIDFSNLKKSEDFAEIDLQEYEEMIFYVAPPVVSEINVYLEKLDDAFLKENFHPIEMSQEDIYPWSWGDSDFQRLVETFRKLKNVVKEAVADENYIFVCIG